MPGGSVASTCSVTSRTVDWAVRNGITTCTFHIQTPYPGTRLYQALSSEGRIVSNNWDRYDTRHVVYRPARLSPEQLKDGYERAYRDFYGWRDIARASLVHQSGKHRAKHFFYAAGWKKFEPLWNFMIKTERLARMTPVLEAVLAKVTSRLGKASCPATAPGALHSAGRVEKAWNVMGSEAK